MNKRIRSPWFSSTVAILLPAPGPGTGGKKTRLPLACPGMSRSIHPSRRGRTIWSSTAGIRREVWHRIEWVVNVANSDPTQQASISRT